jgi:hypothetical protein
MKKYIFGFAALALIVVGFGIGYNDNRAKASTKRLKRLRNLHGEGRICDKCAKNDFIAYQPCWKPTLEQIAKGDKACSVCIAWGKCCKKEETECCCWDVKETCYKKCKIPRIPVKKEEGRVF